MYDTPMVDVPAGDWISLREACKIINCPKRTALYYVETKLLPAVMIDGFWIVLRREAEKFVKPKRGRRPKTQPAPEPKRKRGGK